MEAGEWFQEWSEGQRRSYRETADLHQAHQEALQRHRAFKGGLHWKRIKGRDYLYRYRDRRGHGASLGPRSPDTERRLAEFSQERRRSREHLRRLKARLAEQARFCRAAQLHRVPRPAARILAQLARQEDWGEQLLVVGAQAVYAYEFAAGAFLVGPEAVELAAGAWSRLTLAAATDVDQDAFLQLLRRADRSFEAAAGDGLEAVNRRGFRVRLLTPSRYPRKGNGPGEPAAAEGADLRGLVAAPRFPAVVIGQDGFPVTLTAPDPRAFALHKLWLAERPERDPARRRRDRLQALAVAGLVLRYLPQYYFFSADLRRFPEELVRQAAQAAEESELAAELDIEY